MAVFETQWTCKGPAMRMLAMHRAGGRYATRLWGSSSDCVRRGCCVVWEDWCAGEADGAAASSAIIPHGSSAGTCHFLRCVAAERARGAERRGHDAGDAGRWGRAEVFVGEEGGQ